VVESSPKALNVTRFGQATEPLIDGFPCAQVQKVFGRKYLTSSRPADLVKYLYGDGLHGQHLYLSEKCIRFSDKRKGNLGTLEAPDSAFVDGCRAMLAEITL
jgi:hypothetical protein